MTLPTLQNAEKPKFSSWVQFIGHLKEPLLIPWSNDGKVYAQNIFNVESKDELIKLANGEIVQMLMMQGMMVARPDNPKIITIEHLMSCEFKFLVPMWNIRYIETKFTTTTEVPRSDDKTVVTGQHPETHEGKAS
jgi:hypothetical protein